MIPDDNIFTTQLTVEVPAQGVFALVQWQFRAINQALIGLYLELSLLDMVMRRLDQT